MRNHGFVYEQHHEWWLSPAYDLNPTPVNIKPRILSTAIDFEDSTASVDIALSVIDEFRLSKEQAQKIVSEVAAVVPEEKVITKQLGLSTREIERMAFAFEHEDSEKARRG